MGVKYMRKFAIGAIALFVLLAIALSATAGPAEHKATGGGWFIPEEGAEKITVAFTAQIDADGNVKGQMQAQSRYTDGKLTFQADVIGLDVVDNVATMHLIVTKTSDPMLPIGFEFQAIVVDDGEGKNAVDTIDGYAFNGNIQVT